MKKIIGLTGPTGAGKSSACAICKELGIKHIDCDIIARKATEKGEEGLLAVVKAFGEDILNADGTLNRKALAEKAFKDADSTDLLNKTLLPIIHKMVLNEIEQAESPKDVSIIFSDIKRGKKGEDTKKDIEEFLANIPAEYKKLFVLNKCHQDYINNKPINAYRDILYLLREFGIDENHMRYKKR